MKIEKILDKKEETDKKGSVLLTNDDSWIGIKTKHGVIRYADFNGLYFISTTKLSSYSRCCLYIVTMDNSDED